MQNGNILAIMMGYLQQTKMLIYRNGDRMTKKKRRSKKIMSRHITELPKEERAVYLEERKKRTIEARQKQRDTHVLLTVLILLICASGFFIYEIKRWRLEEISSVPVAAVVEAEPEPEEIKEPTSWEKIWADSSRYPESFLKALRRNPEIADFVEAYPDMPAEKTGGIRLMEKQEETPLFLQWDSRWGYVPYGQSNIGISGCGPTCLSMVLFSLTRNESLTPDALAGRAMEEGHHVEGEGTPCLFMRDIAVECGVKVTQFLYMDEPTMEAELEAGKLIICAMGPGDFTDDGHFIVLTGYEEGQFTINDPFSKANSRKKWDYSTLQPQTLQSWVYEKQETAH